MKLCMSPLAIRVCERNQEEKLLYVCALREREEHLRRSCFGDCAVLVMMMMMMMWIDELL
jgi:hypothetical protein